MGTATHTLENYIALAMPALTEIPGFTALAKADGQDYDALAAKYPDAVFALMIANNLFHHNREISEITQQAFFSIMDGMDIPSVRRQYDRSTDVYFQTHSWDN